MIITLSGTALGWNKYEIVKQSQGQCFLRSTWEMFKQYSTSICSVQVKWLWHSWYDIKYTDGFLFDVWDVLYLCFTLDSQGFRDPALPESTRFQCGEGSGDAVSLPGLAQVAQHRQTACHLWTPSCHQKLLCRGMALPWQGWKKYPILSQYSFHVIISVQAPQKIQTQKPVC